jgi:murein DD-endopeptidase MepM/ murein hydrolase activator NlpD
MGAMRAFRPSTIAGLPALVLVGCATAAGSTLPLDVSLRSRVTAPGEPVRIEVVAAEGMAAVGGSFLGRELHFVRSGGDSHGGELWSAWALVDLEAAPGPAAVEVHGTTRHGRTAAGTLAVRVAAKEFPTEELSVAPRYVAPPPEVEARLARERERLAHVYAARRDELPRGPFVRPVPGEPTSVFGTRRVYNGEPRSPHPGLDLRARTGTPVGASGSGSVVLAEELYYSGNTVIVDHGAGLFTLYAHLDTIDVALGDRVAPGEPLGTSGATGRVTGPHLHWGAKVGDAPFDPSALLDPVLFRQGTRGPAVAGPREPP